MNITFTLELSSHTNTTKEVSILIRMTQNRKLNRMATGIEVLPGTRDPIKKKIRKKHPLDDQYNKVTDPKIAEVIQKTYKTFTEWYSFPCASAYAHRKCVYTCWMA